MISPADMVLFATVVRAGSFTGAAAQLGITKQTASERIAKLERELGVRLLERTTRSLRVTGAGGAYYERCAAIASQIEEANREVRQQDAEPAGLLRVSSPPLFARRYLGSLVSRFLAQYPRVLVELVLSDGRARLVEEGLDLAVHIGPLPDSDLVARKLGEVSTYIVASPGFLSRQGRLRSRDLAVARTVGLRPIEIWPVGGARVRTEPIFIVDDLELACEAAIGGVGIARVPEVLCQDAIGDGRLKILFGPRPAAVRPVYAVYPSRVNLPAKVRLFVDALAQHVAVELGASNRSGRTERVQAATRRGRPSRTPRGRR